MILSNFSLVYYFNINLVVVDRRRSKLLLCAKIHQSTSEHRFSKVLLSATNSHFHSLLTPKHYYMKAPPSPDRLCSSTATVVKCCQSAHFFTARRANRINPGLTLQAPEQRNGVGCGLPVCPLPGTFDSHWRPLLQLSHGLIAWPFLCSWCPCAPAPPQLLSHQDHREHCPPVDILIVTVPGTVLFHLIRVGAK